MDSTTTLNTVNTVNSLNTNHEQVSPTKRHKHDGVDVLHKHIYGDILTRMIAFLDCSHVNLLGQLNRTWKKCIFSDKKRVPWITKDVSLFIEHYTRQVLFDANNQPALIKEKKFLLLLKVERSVEEVQIFPSFYIHRFTEQRLLPHHILSMPNLQKLKLKGDVDFTDFIRIKHSSFTGLKSLKFKYCSQITEEDLSHLNHLAFLETLKLHHCSRITHVDLTKFTRLQTFYLDDAPNMAHVNLEACTELGHLTITGCPQITDSSFDLSRLSQLKTLNLGSTSISNATLFTLKNCTKLHTLNLSNCAHITDIGLSYLKECTALCALFLSGSPLTNQALSHVSHLSALTTLDLSKWAITDEGLLPLQSLTDLVLLDLSNCPITDIGLSYLTFFPALRHLYLRKCSQITNEGFIYFKALTTLRSLHLTGCPKVDDAVVPHLKLCTPLKSLFIGKHSHMTSDGLSALQEQLPELTIYPPPQTTSTPVQNT